MNKNLFPFLLYIKKACMYLWRVTCFSSTSSWSSVRFFISDCSCDLFGINWMRSVIPLKQKGRKYMPISIAKLTYKPDQLHAWCFRYKTIKSDVKWNSSRETCFRIVIGKRRQPLQLQLTANRFTYLFYVRDCNSFCAANHDGDLP